MQPKDPKQSPVDRRRAVKIITIGGVVATLMLPSRWKKPEVLGVILPAHAQASPWWTTTTTTTTTTPAPTTTESPPTTPV